MFLVNSSRCGSTPGFDLSAADDVGLWAHAARGAMASRRLAAGPRRSVSLVRAVRARTSDGVGGSELGGSDVSAWRRRSLSRAGQASPAGRFALGSVRLRSLACVGVVGDSGFAVSLDRRWGCAFTAFAGRVPFFGIDQPLAGFAGRLWDDAGDDSLASTFRRLRVRYFGNVNDIGVRPRVGLPDGRISGSESVGSPARRRVRHAVNRRLVRRQQLVDAGRVVGDGFQVDDRGHRAGVHRARRGRHPAVVVFAASAICAGAAAFVTCPGSPRSGRQPKCWQPIERRGRRPAATPGRAQTPRQLVQPIFSRDFDSRGNRRAVVTAEAGRYNRRHVRTATRPWISSIHGR